MERLIVFGVNFVHKDFDSFMSGNFRIESGRERGLEFIEKAVPVLFELLMGVDLRS